MSVERGGIIYKIADGASQGLGAIVTFVSRWYLEHPLIAPSAHPSLKSCFRKEVYSTWIVFTSCFLSYKFRFFSWRVIKSCERLIWLGLFRLSLLFCCTHQTSFCYPGSELFNILQRVNIQVISVFVPWFLATRVLVYLFIYCTENWEYIPISPTMVSIVPSAEFFVYYDILYFFVYYFVILSCNFVIL